MSTEVTKAERRKTARDNAWAMRVGEQKCDGYGMEYDRVEWDPAMRCWWLHAVAASGEEVTLCLGA